MTAASTPDVKEATLAFTGEVDEVYCPGNKFDLFQEFDEAQENIG